MHSTTLHCHPLRRFAPGAALLLISFAAAHGQSKTLPANTRFLIPEPPSGAVQQVESLLQQRQLKNALLITAMETVPQAVWLTSGTPSEVGATVTSTLRQANVERAVPCWCSTTFLAGIAVATRRAARR